MNRSFILRALLSTAFLFALFPTVQAKVFFKTEKSFTSYHSTNEITSLRVTKEYVLQDGKQTKGQQKPATNAKPNQPEIKTVPKARKQPRPAVVAKPKVNAKPIKVVRPNIKKP